ncbi:CYTH domain-containing protein [Candidatus Gracilibacteria bacterium]|nr:CYTH domain-containing protein [Candidatus Gracilibacteria bacterium]NJM86802.1 CYTH domain-containing protein [Hydrococcus sp. RU_2_2]NJP17765.1 CYTH domain-containing protein [Hydrococcus sp. CRU_1_1]
MAIEIERKFLVKGDTWRSLGTGQVYRQGYITTVNSTTVRIRIVGDRGYLTIKGKTDGIARSEFEYLIPVEDAQSMLDTLCDRPLIEKIRYKIQFGNLLWEVDEFLGENQGLIMAEVELDDANRTIELPDWIAKEVSSDRKYYNSNLAKYPYQQWKDFEK